MKKRILAALICAVIVMLSGCSGTETPKPVESKDEFFSRIAGMYYHIRLADIMSEEQFANDLVQDFIFDCVCVRENGSFWVRYLTPYDESMEAMYLTGVFQTVYNDDEFSYHVSISKLTPLLIAKKPPSADLIVDFKPDSGDWWSKFSSNFNASESICSNDLFYIYPPGTPNTHIPKLLNADSNLAADGYIPDEGVYDRDYDGKLDDNLLYDKNTEFGYKRINNNNNIETGIWIDYISEAPLIKVYEYNNCAINVTRYNLLEGSIKTLESKNGASDSLFNVAYSSNSIMTNGIDKYISTESVNDKNKMKIIAGASNDPNIKKDYYLYRYNKLPGNDTLIKDSAKAKAEYERTTN